MKSIILVAVIIAALAFQDQGKDHVWLYLDIKKIEAGRKLSWEDKKDFYIHYLDTIPVTDVYLYDPVKNKDTDIGILVFTGYIDITRLKYKKFNDSAYWSMIHKYFTRKL